MSGWCILSGGGFPLGRNSGRGLPSQATGKGLPGASEGKLGPGRDVNRTASARPRRRRRGGPRQGSQQERIPAVGVFQLVPNNLRRHPLRRLPRGGHLRFGEAQIRGGRAPENKRCVLSALAYLLNPNSHAPPFPSPRPTRTLPFRPTRLTNQPFPFHPSSPQTR